ncbi:MAG: PAS domain S-box protein, partial [Kiritimatiellales bacterium]
RKNRELNVCLFQLNPGQEPYFMAGSSRQCGLPCWDDQDPGLRSTVPVFRFGKTYAFRAGPSPDWLAKHPLRNGWPACGIGLLLSLLVSALTAMLVNRQLVLERMVEHRTDELKRAEKTLAHLNRQYEMILSSMAEGILGLDLRGNHIFVNPAAAKMLGYEIEELIGRPSHSLWHHSKADGTPYPEDECKIHAASKAGKSCRASNEVFWRKDGSSFPVAYNSGPILESGQPAGAVITFDDITERRRTEASLMASKARFRDIAMNISDLIWEMDTQGVLRYVSGQSVGLLGYTAEELVGTTRFNRMHAQQAEAANAFFAERFRDHKPFRDYENWTVHKDGTPICILSSGMPMFSEAGIFIGYCGADTDITTRKGYEEDIKQSVSLLEATLDATADGILVVDGKGRILRFNRKFIEMWKIPDDIIASGSEAAVLDMVLGQLCEPEVFLAKVRALSRQPDAISFDVLNFHDGRVFERNSQPQRIAGRVGGRAWSFHDVTRREQAEALLWASQTKLDLALQSASMGVWQWDVITDTHTYDRQACAFMGINPATFGGTEAEIFAVVHPADRQNIKEALTRTVEQHAPYDMEYRAICPDGMVRHIATRAQLFLDDGDRQLKVTGVCWDITDRRKAEARMHLLMEHLQTVREEERKRIARELHDDIGQILTAIKIDLSVVESGCRCQGDLKNKMGGIQQMLRTGIESIHSLCRQLRPGALDDLDLSDALEGLIDDWKKRNQVECALYADVDDEMLSDGVKTAAFRVTQEALTNISRYAQASKVEVNLVADEQAFNITITDDGLGMEPGAADKPTSFGLLGMRERVEALGGTLSIESSPGKGTRIEATLPLPRNGELKTGDFG